ncbi:hypothetical protein AVEN_201462-1, partial [Araneus ventricosus]
NFVDNHPKTGQIVIWDSVVKSEAARGNFTNWTKRKHGAP